VITKSADSGPLVFIDTSKWLPFYEGLGEEQGAKILKTIEANASRLIMTEQVHMEFLKNRQAKLVAAITKLKSVQEGAVSPPPLLRTPQSEVHKKLKDLNAAVEAEQKHIEAILLKPQKNDAVFQLVTSLIEADGPLVLMREDAAWAAVEERARKRWELGYPPRKASDTSYGDAINWEWIVSCAEDERRDVVIVTNDSDYGVLLEKDRRLINDWLAREFKKRTKHTVRATSLFSEAFRASDKPLSEPEAEAEERTTATATSALSFPSGSGVTGLFGQPFSLPSATVEYLNSLLSAREAPAFSPDLNPGLLEVLRKARASRDSPG
jgi:hypothetical protein